MLARDTMVGVRAAEDLVNTLDVETGQDDLTDLEDLDRFRAAHGFSFPGAPDERDLAALRELRAELRAALTSEEREAIGLLNGLVARNDATPYLSDHDGEAWHLHFTPQEAPWAQSVTADLAMALLFVIRDLGVERFGTCAAEGCSDVFIDTSRNRSRRYCDPVTCGNRTHVAAYRARRRARGPSSPSTTG